MRVEKLTLVNFCQHHFREIEFQPGLTAIIGPNGSGKSNILGAMKYAMTGDHPNAGGKNANIRQDTPGGERSYVEFTFSHGNVEAIVRRNLKPASPTTVMVNNEFQARGDRDTNEWICNLLNTDAQILNDIVIVDQEDIFGFLSQLPAKRAASFAKLFHTDAAETAWHAIGNHLSGLQIPQLPVDLRATEQALEADGFRKTEIESCLAGDSVASIEQTMACDDQVMAAWKRRCEYGNVGLELQQRRLPLIQQHTDAQEAQAKAGIHVRTLQEAADASKDVAVTSSKALILLEQAKLYERQKNAVTTEIARHTVALDNLVDPVKPPRYGEDLENMEAGARTVWCRWKDFVESFDESKDTTECPTCGTPVATLQPRLDQARQELPKMRQTVTDLSVAISACRTYGQDLVQVAAERLRLQSLLEAAQRRRAELVVVAEPTNLSVEELQTCIVAHEEFVKAIVTYKEESARHAQTVASLAGQLQELDKQIAAAQKAVSDIPVTAVEYDAAAARHRQLTERRGGVRAMERELIEVNTRLTHNQQLKEQCAATAREIEVKEAWATRAQRMRDVLHRDAAPKLVAQRNLARLQQGINEQLEMFATEYRVSSDLELSFAAHFNDGREQPAARLSVGQKVILALGFRLAVSFMYADLGFLALDEPTAYLDEHHIAGFEPVLGRLREFAASRGLQCLMVTHEQSLAPLFDSVFQL